MKFSFCILFTFVLSIAEAAYSADTLHKKFQAQLKRIINDKRLAAYHHTAHQISKSYKSLRFLLSQQLLTDLERVQSAITRLRSTNQYFVDEKKWTTWSVAHSQAVYFDRANRIISLSKGRPHRVNLKNFEKSALLLGIALSSTISIADKQQRDFVLSHVAPPLVSALRTANVDGELRAVIALIDEYGSESHYAISGVLSFAVVFMVGYMLVKRISTL